MPRRGDLKSLVGQRFGRLKVMAFAGMNKHRRSMWLCKCDCGGDAEVTDCNLKSGSAQSCGCIHVESMRDLFTTHGHATVGARSPEYQSWCAMWARVRAKTGRRWRDYGSRGIAACDRWKTFENFLADMGSRPAGTSLDRKDNDGNYEPSNCRWATDGEQIRNRRPPAQWSRQRDLETVHPELSE